MNSLKPFFDQKTPPGPHINSKKCFTKFFVFAKIFTTIHKKTRVGRSLIGFSSNTLVLCERKAIQSWKRANCSPRSLVMSDLRESLTVALLKRLTGVNRSRRSLKKSNEQRVTGAIPSWCVYTPYSNNLKIWKPPYLKKKLRIRIINNYAERRFSNFAIEYLCENSKLSVHMGTR